MQNKIYKITNIVNGKIYIGCTYQQDPYKRFKAHLNNSKKPDKFSGVHLYSAMRKHGTDKFTFEIIESFKTRKEMFDREKELIKKLNTMVNGYNNHPGGKGGKAKGSVPWNKGLKFLDKTKHNRYGKKHSKETKLLLSKQRKSKEYKDKMMSTWVKNNTGSSNPNAKTRKLSTPDGIITITCLAEYCRDNNLSKASMYKSYRESRPIKGYQLLD